jgi:RNA polymerase sigma-70 factor (ECF subfamily)
LHGDQGAIRLLVDRFRGRVYGLCYRMLGHRQDAEDVTQESLVRAVRGLHRWDAAREFVPWLLAIAANRCRTHLATNAKRRGASHQVETLVDARVDRLEARQTAEEIETALRLLRPDHRRAFLLFHVEGRSYIEIAAECRVPLGTVKTWVHRARRELAERLRERDLVEGPAHAL